MNSAEQLVAMFKGATNERDMLKRENAKLQSLVDQLRVELQDAREFAAKAEVKSAALYSQCQLKDRSFYEETREIKKKLAEFHKENADLKIKCEQLEEIKCAEELKLNECLAKLESAESANEIANSALIKASKAIQKLEQELSDKMEWKEQSMLLQIQLDRSNEKIGILEEENGILLSDNFELREKFKHFAEIENCKEIEVQQKRKISRIQQSPKKKKKTRNEFELKKPVSEKLEIESVVSDSFSESENHFDSSDEEWSIEPIKPSHHDLKNEIRSLKCVLSIDEKPGFEKVDLFTEFENLKNNIANMKLEKTVHCVHIVSRAYAKLQELSRSFFGNVFTGEVFDRLFEVLLSIAEHLHENPFFDIYRHQVMSMIEYSITLESDLLPALAFLAACKLKSENQLSNIFLFDYLTKSLKDSFDWGYIVAFWASSLRILQHNSDTECLPVNANSFVFSTIKIALRKLVLSQKRTILDVEVYNFSKMSKSQIDRSLEFMQFKTCRCRRIEIFGEHLESESGHYEIIKEFKQSHEHSLRFVAEKCAELLNLLVVN